MNKRMFLIAAVLVITGAAAVQAEEYGKVRAMRERAIHVTTLKNDFVSRVLTSYGIPHECNPEGAVVRINMDGKWLNINAIEIVPVLKESADKHQQVTAHELFFYTDEGIIDLVSELIIR